MVEVEKFVAETEVLVGAVDVFIEVVVSVVDDGDGAGVVLSDSGVFVDDNDGTDVDFSANVAAVDIVIDFDDFDVLVTDCVEGGDVVSVDEFCNDAVIKIDDVEIVAVESSAIPDDMFVSAAE